MNKQHNLKDEGEKMRLKGKISVITGAGGGIGRSIAIAFAKEGSNLVLADSSREHLENIAQEIKAGGSRVLQVPCDVSSVQDVSNLAKVVRDEFGLLDILINNAGINKRSKFLEYDDETWLEIIRVNLFGVYLCSKQLLPLIQQVGRGRIINMASVAGKIPVPFNIAYGVSKHGVLGLTKSLASEVAILGYPEITVNAICPFLVDTQMFRGPQGYTSQMAKMGGMPEKEIVEKAVGRSLQHRIIKPEEVASLAVFLASDDARGITGQAINICGGRIFH